jgi:hypothetical protein
VKGDEEEVVEGWRKRGRRLMEGNIFGFRSEVKLGENIGNSVVAREQV